MADETTASTPGAFLNEVRAGVEQDLEQRYAERLVSARAQIRREQDEADGARICAVRDEMGARMAEYRRGRWYHLGAIITSAAAGFTAGFISQRNADLRVQGVPVLAVAGLPGIVLGARLDESMAARACLAVGGTMFAVGTVTHALLNPEPKGTPV